jgi:hypothetical protein
MSGKQSHFIEHHEEVWRKLASQVGGELERKGTWKADKLRVEHGDWTITLDVRTVPGFKSEEHFTRLRAPVLNTEGFRFAIYQKTVLSRIAEYFAMDCIVTGYPMIDDAYVVRTNDEERIRGLLSKEEIRIRIEALRDFYLHLHEDEGFHADQYPGGVEELYLEVPDVIDDIDRLKQCYELFSLVLQTLDSTNR